MWPRVGSCGGLWTRTWTARTSWRSPTGAAVVATAFIRDDVSHAASRRSSAAGHDQWHVGKGNFIIPGSGTNVCREGECTPGLGTNGV
eukprot:2583204-Pyramimonas_sp.AAC.3